MLKKSTKNKLNIRTIYNIFNEIKNIIFMLKFLFRPHLAEENLI